MRWKLQRGFIHFEPSKCLYKLVSDDNLTTLLSLAQMKSVASEERRIQQQIVAQQRKELTSFLDDQKKEYRLCKEKIKEVNTQSSLTHVELTFSHKFVEMALRSYCTVFAIVVLDVLRR